LTITTSGEYTKVKDSEIILPRDIIRFTSFVQGYSKGRVIFVDIEYRTRVNRIALEGSIILIVQLVASQAKLSDVLDIDLDMDCREMILINNMVDIIKGNICYKVDVFI
jgi:hypothetical protein